jgi:hypothetical protein
MIDSILSTAMNSINQATEKAYNNAQSISDATSPEYMNDDALVTGIIGLKESETQVKASAKLIKVSQEMNDCILDIMA